MIKKGKRGATSRAVFVRVGLIVCCLFSQSVSFDCFANQEEAKHQRFSIPPEYGVVDESHVSKKSPKAIIYIQDAHASLEAQENIAKIVSHLVKEKGVKTVFEEGYEGPVPTDKLFSVIPELEIKERVAFFLLDKLRIGGAEYAHVNRTHDFKLVGADSASLHLENNLWASEVAKTREETDRDLKELAKHIRQLADRYFPKDLKKWLKLRESFDKGDLPLIDYLVQIQKLILKNKSSESFRADYPSLNVILDAHSSTDLELLNKAKAINFKALFQEIESLEGEFSNGYPTNPRDLEIFRYAKLLSLAQKLNNLEVSQEEYGVLKDSLKALDTQKLADFIVQNTNKSIVLSKGWEESLVKSINFYETARKRDDTIQLTLSSFLSDPDEDAAILVYGGFHRSAIEDILKKLNCSYLIVSPKITQKDPYHEAYYKELMANGLYYHKFAGVANKSSRPLNLMEIADLIGIAQVEVYLKNLANIVSERMSLSVFLLNQELGQVELIGAPETLDSALIPMAGTKYVKAASLGESGEKTEPTLLIRGKYRTVLIDESNVASVAALGDCCPPYKSLIHEDIIALAHIFADMTPLEIIQNIAAVTTEVSPIQVGDLAGDIDISFLDAGLEKYVFLLKIKLKNERHIEFLVPVPRVRTYDKRGLYRDYRHDMRREFEDLKKLNGKYAPRVGAQGEMSDGRVWYVREYIKGEIASKAVREILDPTLVHKIVTTGLQMVLDNFNGYLPMDMLNANNVIIRNDTKEIVFFDLGLDRLDLDNENVGYKERIFLLILITKLLHQSETEEGVFGSFLAVLGKEKGLRFLDEIYSNIKFLGIEETTSAVLQMTKQKYGQDFSQSKYVALYPNAYEKYLETISESDRLNKVPTKEGIQFEKYFSSGRSLGGAESVPFWKGDSDIHPQFNMSRTMDSLTKPTLIFVDFKNLRTNFSKGEKSQEEELYSLVTLNQKKYGKKVELVIYNANKLDSTLTAYRALDNVKIFEGNAPDAFKNFGVNYAHTILHLSKEGVEPRGDFYSAQKNRMKFFRYEGDKPGLAVAMLLYAEFDGYLMGLDEKEGFVYLTGKTLDFLVQEYLASLVIRKAA